MADRRAVQAGGFWNSQSASFSAETQALLKEMMKESKLTNFQQRQLSAKMKNGESLPTTCNPTSSAKPRNPMPKALPPKYLNPRTSPGTHLRTAETIEASGAYERPDYTPNPGKAITDKDKARLANIMAYGEDIPPPSQQKVIQRALPPEEPEIDRFDELQKEIQDRRDFLASMEEIGQGQRFRTIIETEISQLIREMELLDKKRTAELERIMAMQDKRKKKTESSSND